MCKDPWLADKLVQTTDAQSKEVARKVAVYQKMLSDKKFDEIIAYNKTDNLVLVGLRGHSSDSQGQRGEG